MGSSKGGGGRLPSFLNSRNDIATLIKMQENASNRAAERTAAFNFFDTFTPFGSQRFEGTPGQEDFRAIQELPGAEQEFLDRSRDIRQTLQGLGQQQLEGFGQDIFGQPILGGQDLTDSAAQLEQATFDRARNLLEPGFEQERSRLENSLIQRGLPRSGEAFGQEFDDLSRRQGSALENLALSSVGAGRQEQSRLLQSDLARRAGTLNELGGLALGTASAPAFQATPNINVAATDVNSPFAMAANAQQQAQAQKQAGKAAGKGGLATLGSAGLLAATGGASGAGKAVGKGAAPQVGSQFSPFAIGAV